MKHNYDFNDLKRLIVPTQKKGLEAGDTIIIPYNGIDTEFVVLGVNINPNPDETIDYDFIDIMSKELLIPVGIQWKKEITDTNFDDPNYDCLNFVKSDIINELHSKLKLFPNEVQDAVISRKMRFLTGLNPITNEKTYTTIDIGPIWLPSIKEICDNCFTSDSDPESKQYPYFENEENRKLGDWWWTCSARAFHCDAYYIYSVGGHGYRYATSSVCGSPLCLRLKIKMD